MTGPDPVVRGLRLEAATLGWNVLAIGAVAVAAVRARSVALAGFGLDSAIEIFASLVVVHELRGDGDPAREARSLRRIGMAFVGLSTYVVVQAVASVVLGIRPDASPLGIAWLAVTVPVMFGLAAAKARAGVASGNRVLATEARVTAVDGALAAAVLVGLVLNAAVGWWWADVAAGVVIAGYGAREARHAFHHASTPA